MPPEHKPITRLTKQWNVEPIFVYVSRHEEHDDDIDEWIIHHPRAGNWDIVVQRDHINPLIKHVWYVFQDENDALYFKLRFG